LGLFGLGIHYLGGPARFWEGLPADHRMPLAPLNYPPKLHAVGDFWNDAMVGTFAFFCINQGVLMRFLSARSVRDGRKAMFFVVLGASVWVDRMTASIRSTTIDNMSLQDFRHANTEADLARALHAQGKLSEAEPKYRSAVLTFQRLGRTKPDKLGRALLGLGRLLIQVEKAKGAEPAEDSEKAVEKDMAGAEAYLVEALAIFRDGSSTWQEQQKEALQSLHWLYTEIWEEPERLAEINRDLLALAVGRTTPVTSPASSSP
ncbi:MAG: hypothetical protein IH987_16230, partial [Planctomycetes bacterium]|nr:hypothetical protein [Planctomycetota bacterium]